MNTPVAPQPAPSERSEERSDEGSRVISRILARAGTAGAGGSPVTPGPNGAVAPRRSDGEQFDLADRQALRRVAGLSTELEDVTEVEYRQLRLERVVLAGVWAEDAESAEVSLRELAALAETAGSAVVDGVLQRRDAPDKATWLGKGKAEELRGLVAASGADTVVCDGELSPSQRRGLEDVVKVKVIDRTALILDIFAQHAKSREGKAQVEYAQYDYLLPRLRGWGESMSRQAGGRVAGGAGIGSRGRAPWRRSRGAAWPSACGSGAGRSPSWSHQVRASRSRRPRRHGHPPGGTWTRPSRAGAAAGTPAGRARPAPCPPGTSRAGRRCRG